MEEVHKIKDRYGYKAFYHCEGRNYHLYDLYKVETYRKYAGKTEYYVTYVYNEHNQLIRTHVGNVISDIAYKSSLWKAISEGKNSWD